MKKRSHKIIFIITISLLLATVFEFVIFKIPYFIDILASGDNYVSVGLKNVKTSHNVDLDEQGNLVLGSGSNIITINDLKGNYNSLKLDIEAPEDVYAEITIDFADIDSEMPKFKSYGSFKFTPYDKESAWFELSPQKFTTLRLTFNSASNGAVIKAIELDAKPYFEISFYRFFITAILILTVFTVIVFKLYKKNYDHANPNHRKLVLCVIVVLLIFSTFVSSFNRAYTVEYPTKDDKYAYGNYVLQLEAFVKGQIHLDIEKPPRFDLLENPFSPSERRELNIDTKWIWDKAYYNDHFYSYFGVIPVILVYLPVYMLTGRVATDPFCCYLFSMLAIVCSSLFLRELVLRYLKKANILLLCLGMATISFAGMILPMQASANFYTVAVSSALGTISAFFFFAFRGARERTTYKRCIYFFFAGMFLALTVGCRPNVSVYGAIALPALFAVLMEKETNARAKVCMVSSFVAPIFAIVGGLMYYNALRFSGPLDFGTNYQITLADVSQYELRLSYIFETFFHYFLQPFGVHDWFPFVGLSRISLGTYTGYCYTGENIGAFSFFSNITILSSLRNRRKLGNEGTAFVATSLFMVAVIAWMDMCLAGTHVRYVSDILLVVTILACFTMIRSFSENPSRIKKYAFVFLMMCSILVGTALIFDNEVDLIRKNAPAILLEFQRMF